MEHLCQTGVHRSLCSGANLVHVGLDAPLFFADVMGGGSEVKILNVGCKSFWPKDV